MGRSLAVDVVEKRKVSCRFANWIPILRSSSPKPSLSTPAYCSGLLWQYYFFFFWELSIVRIKRSRTLINVPSKLRVRFRAAAVILPHTSPSILRSFFFFFALVCSQFELIKIKMAKVNYNFLLFLRAYNFCVCYGFFKNRFPPPPPGCSSQPNCCSEPCLIAFWGFDQVA
jgi:hypothetical protein